MARSFVLWILALAASPAGAQTPIDPDLAFAVAVQAQARPTFGVAVSAVDGPAGLRVEQVEARSVASRSLVQIGDVLLRMGDVDLTDPGSLDRAMEACAGRAVAVEVLRDGQPKTLAAVVPEAPASDVARSYDRDPGVHRTPLALPADAAEVPIRGDLPSMDDIRDRIDMPDVDDIMDDVHDRYR